MEAHDFDALLRSVAEEVQEPVKENLFDNKEPDLFGSHVSSRWYLKETADEVDTAEQEKEDAAAARLEKHMGAHLRKHPEDEGVHYSDLFEQYLPDRRQAEAAAGRLAARNTSSRRPSGTWRPPDNEQEREQKAALRADGHLAADQAVRQRPDRRRAGAGQGPPRQRPDLLDWLRQCRRAGLYEQGKAIYEKGGLNSRQPDRRAADRGRGRLPHLRPPRQRRRGEAEEEAPKEENGRRRGGIMTKTLHGKVHGKTIELRRRPWRGRGPGSRDPGEARSTGPEKGRGLLRPREHWRTIRNGTPS